MRLSRLVVFLSPLLLGGCATVLTGTRQDIQVDSQPAGAVCTFTRAGANLGSVTTPGSLNIQRNAAPVTVVCTRDDYEEARAVLNARREMVTIGSAIIGGFIATHIDRGSGASNRYETSLRVELTPMSAADRAAAAAARTAGPSVAAAGPSVPAAGPPVPAAGPFDGSYRGGFSASATAVYSMYALRQVDLVVAGGSGAGTVSHALCKPGTMTLAIDPSGAVSGEADVLSDSCGARRTALQGKVEGDRLVLRMTLGSRIVDFTMTRHASGA